MEDDFFRFIHAEQKYIEDAKWYEGIRICRDPGDEYIMQWTAEHAKEFRERWNESVCRTCILCCACGNNVYKKCDSYRAEK